MEINHSRFNICLEQTTASSQQPKAETTPLASIVAVISEYTNQLPKENLANKTIKDLTQKYSARWSPVIYQNLLAELAENLDQAKYSDTIEKINQFIAETSMGFAESNVEKKMPTKLRDLAELLKNIPHCDLSLEAIYLDLSSKHEILELDLIFENFTSFLACLKMETDLNSKKLDYMAATTLTKLAVRFILSGYQDKEVNLLKKIEELYEPTNLFKKSNIAIAQRSIRSAYLITKQYEKFESSILNPKEYTESDKLLKKYVLIEAWGDSKLNEQLEISLVNFQELCKKEDPKTEQLTALLKNVSNANAKGGDQNLALKMLNLNRELSKNPQVFHQDFIDAINSIKVILHFYVRENRFEEAFKIIKSFIPVTPFINQRREEYSSAIISILETHFLMNHQFSLEYLDIIEHETDKKNLVVKVLIYMLGKGSFLKARNLALEADQLLNLEDNFFEKKIDQYIKNFNNN